MSKPVIDKGYALAIQRPLQLRRYEAGMQPDPGECTDCLIIVNDRTDGIPRARLCMSNGASWDTLAYLTDRASPGSQQQTVDVTAVVRQAVADMIPQQPAVRVISPEPQVLPPLAAPSASIDMDAIANVMADMLRPLQQQIRELQATNEALKREFGT